MLTSFVEATSVKALDSNTYSANFQPDWCIGTVPHGGYVTSCFLSVAKLHFATTRASYNQPHTIVVQITFLRRTIQGPATFKVTELKLGRRTSALSISVTQSNPPNHDPSSSPLPIVTGIFTQSNIDTEYGLSLTFQTTLSPPAPPRPLSPAALLNDTDPNWKLHTNPFFKFRKATQQIQTYLPRNPITLKKGEQLNPPPLLDQWIRLSNGQRFTQETLGYVVDSFPLLVEQDVYKPQLNAQMSKLGQLPPSSASPPTTTTTTTTATDKEAQEIEKAWRLASSKPDSAAARFWYPTVTLNIDIKRALPDDGVEWLFSRVRSSRVKDGRMDIDVSVFDEEGRLVALSTHVALIVGAERNVSGRSGNGGSEGSGGDKGGGGGGGGSKL